MSELLVKKMGKFLYVELSTNGFALMAAPFHSFSSLCPQEVAHAGD
jgi:hypothetical protein